MCPPIVFGDDGGQSVSAIQLNFRLHDQKASHTFATGIWLAGWQSGSVSATEFVELGAGTYYYLVRAKRGEGLISNPARGRIVLLR